MSIEKPIDELERFCKLDSRYVCGAQIEECCQSATAFVCIRPGQTRAISALHHLSFLGIHPRG